MMVYETEMTILPRKYTLGEKKKEERAGSFTYEIIVDHKHAYK